MRTALQARKALGKKRNHICTRKDPLPSVFCTALQIASPQSGTATITDKTNFTTGLGSSMLHLIPYSKHTASKIQSSHRVGFVLCLLTWMCGGTGQNVHSVNAETANNTTNRQSSSLLL